MVPSVPRQNTGDHRQAAVYGEFKARQSSPVLGRIPAKDPQPLAEPLSAGGALFRGNVSQLDQTYIAGFKFLTKILGKFTDSYPNRHF